MADKLSESAWTAFTKKAKLELDDGALIKALARFDKTSDNKPEARQDALKDIVEQVKKQVAALAKQKKALGDKPFGEAKDKLYSLLDAAESLQRETQQAIAAAAASEDEAETPALLTTKMLPLVRELRKGEARMHALICTAGRNTAVLIMRRAIAPSRRKLLAEAVDAAGGAKYIVGECLFENKALTFVVQSAAAGLAKRLRQALLDQLELRLKVRVRGEDGAEDLDGDDEPEAPGTVEAAGDAPASGASESPEAAPAPSAEQRVYTQKLDKLRERYDAALAAQHPEATKLRALMGFASEKADAQHDYPAASQALDMLNKLLGAGAPAATDASPATAEAAPGDPAAAFKSRLAALIPRIKQAAADAHARAAEMRTAAGEAGVLAGKKQFAEAGALLDRVEGWFAPPGGGGSSGGAAAALSVWRDAKEQADAEINRLREKLVGSGRPQLLRIAEQGITDGGLNALTGGRMVALWAALMDGAAAPQDAGKRARVQQAAAELSQFIASDRRIALCEINPYTGPIQLRGRLLPALAEVDRLVSA